MQCATGKTGNEILDEVTAGLNKQLTVFPTTCSTPLHILKNQSRYYNKYDPDLRPGCVKDLYGKPGICKYLKKCINAAVYLYPVFEIAGLIQKFSFAFYRNTLINIAANDRAAN